MIKNAAGLPIRAHLLAFCKVSECPGKTAGFALPLSQRLVQHGPAVSSNRARGLVLVPTRELAEQVLQSFIDYGKGLD